MVNGFGPQSVLAGCAPEMSGSTRRRIRQERIDDALETADRQSPGQAVRDPHAPVGPDSADQERGRPGNLESLGEREIRTDGFRSFPVKARIELGAIQAKVCREGPPGRSLERLRVRKQPVVHLPELALASGAGRG